MADDLESALEEEAERAFARASEQRSAGATAEAVDSFAAAAGGYAKSGKLLKAISAAKSIFELDPAHGATQGQVASLYATKKKTQLLTLDEIGGGPLEIDLVPGDPIAKLSLAKVVKGAKPADAFPVAGKEIPLDDEAYDSIEIAPAGPMLPPIPLFSSLDEEQLRYLIDHVKVIDRKAGTAIVREGETGESLYVVVRGQVEVTASGESAPIDRLGEGAFFGEIALLTNLVRSATVTAVSDVQLLEIDRALIGQLVGHDAGVLRTLLRFFRDRLMRRLFLSSPLFQAFSPDEARALAERFRFIELEAGAALLEEGKRAPGLFLLLCGTCDVVSGVEHLAELGPGDVAGEMSLLTHAPASATVSTRTRVWALGLSRTEFNELINTHPQVLVYVSDVADERRKATERLRLL